MKLVYCPECQDAFKLGQHLKSCECGLVCGQYDPDMVTAVTNGKGVSLAIGNGSLMTAIHGLSQMDQDEAPRRQYYQPTAPTRITHAWVRPNDGVGNPHCRIDPTLGLDNPTASV